MIEQRGGRAIAMRCDVVRAEDIEAAVDHAARAFGRLDFAFDNAGVEPRGLAPTADWRIEEWDRIMNIDLRGVFLCMKFEIPRSGTAYFFVNVFASLFVVSVSVSSLPETTNL
jgi:NAD(P)-dependent dehydrogenase (short-subunit alcohol dehydrogenase family)